MLALQQPSPNQCPRIWQLPLLLDPLEWIQLLKTDVNIVYIYLKNIFFIINTHEEIVVDYKAIYGTVIVSPLRRSVPSLWSI